MSKENPIEAAPIPPHMLESPTTRGQKKAFAKAKRASKADEPKKATAKKASAKKASASASSGYLSGAGKDEKP